MCITLNLWSLNFRLEINCLKKNANVPLNNPQRLPCPKSNRSPKKFSPWIDKHNIQSGITITSTKNGKGNQFRIQATRFCPYERHETTCTCTLFNNNIHGHYKWCTCMPHTLPSWGGGLKNIPTASLQRGKTPPNECPGYDTKQSDGEVPSMLELWGMQSTPSLPLLPGPLWPGVVAPDKGPMYGLNRTKPCFFHYTDFCI